MATSATFPALTALLAMAQAAMPATVAVRDGRPVTLDPQSDALYIGMPDIFEGDRQAVEAEQTFVGIPPRGRDETWRIRCVSYSWSGEPANYAVLRTRAASYIGLLETALRADPYLSQTALFALITIESINQGPSDEGCSVDVQFSVTGKSRI